MLVKVSNPLAAADASRKFRVSVCRQDEFNDMLPLFTAVSLYGQRH
jgi:hypothetical protein